MNPPFWNFVKIQEMELTKVIQRKSDSFCGKRVVFNAVPLGCVSDPLSRVGSNGRRSRSLLYSIALHPR